MKENNGKKWSTNNVLDTISAEGENRQKHVFPINQNNKGMGICLDDTLTQSIGRTKKCQYIISIPQNTQRQVNRCSLIPLSLVL